MADNELLNLIGSDGANAAPPIPNHPLLSFGMPNNAATSDPDLSDMMTGAGQMARGFGAGLVNPLHVTSWLAKRNGYPGVNQALSTAMRDAPASAGAGQALTSLAAALAGAGLLPEALATGGAALWGGAASFGAKIGAKFDEDPDSNLKPNEPPMFHFRDIFHKNKLANNRIDDWYLYHMTPRSPMTYPDNDQGDNRWGWSKSLSDTSARKWAETNR